jgi:hypothetical protein
MLSAVHICYYSTLHLHIPLPVYCDLLTYRARTVPVHCKLGVIFTIIKPTRCTNFSNFILGMKLNRFRTAVSRLVWHIPLLCVQWKTPDDGQRNCLKRVEFHSKNKFEKLVRLVGFIIRNLSQCTVT